MRLRFWILVGTLVVVAGLATVVHRRRATVDAQRQHLQQQAMARYEALEGNTRQHDETTWKATRLWVTADPWFADWADAVMAVPQRWDALDAGLGKWPGLAALRSQCQQDWAGSWVLERMTWAPFLDAGRPQPSADVTLQFLLSQGRQRAVITARIHSHWKSGSESETHPAPEAPTELSLLSFDRQQADSSFRLWYEANLPVPAHTFFADPLLFRDSPVGAELLLVSAQRRFVFSDPGTAEPPGWRVGPPVTGVPRDRALAAAWADADADGRLDLWIAGRDGLWTSRGNPTGQLDPPTLRWRSPEPLIFPECLAIADIDHDGDLDVWLTQYKNPYQLGQFPTPYYDANDGFRSYLLRNEGAVGFVDGTEVAKLELKRQRRTYSASWLDVDGDGHLDLVNISDFAGLDVYRNDGHGRFTDLTAGLGDQRHGFGMAHVVSDQNGDVLPDVLMVGMDSPWASRLEALRLGRSDFPIHSQKRAAMTAGNRLFHGSSGGLEPGTFPPSLARAGWAWGVAELDVENDGRSDYFFANGHETRASQRDYERQFWLHDIYQAGSTNDPGAELYFRAAAARRTAENASYGGWQHQALLRQTATHGFVESAWLSGVGLLADGRNTLAADFDHDGRMDLAITTVEGGPQVRQRVVIYRNETPQPGHWIGVRFPEGQGRRAGVNARVEVVTKSGVRRRWLVTGDGYRSQQTSQAHFGLGADREVASVTVHWPDGTHTTLPAPAVDRWHDAP